MILAALLAHFLLPHETNNHRARLLHPVFVGLSLFLFFVSQLTISFLPRFTPVVLGYAANIAPETIVELTNEERGRVGAQRLNLDPLLTQAALAKASDMFARDYWAHVSPDGTEPWAFFIDAGYRYRFAGENLARDFTKAEDVVNAWIVSPNHKENLLSPRYQDIGVAVVDGEFRGVQTTLVVQLFGTRFTEAAIGETPATQAGSLAELGPPPEQQPVVAGTASRAKEILLSPFSSTRRIAIFFVSLFLTLLSIDLVIINQRGVARRSSRTFAHLLFLGMIMLVLLVAQQGLIL